MNAASHCDAVIVGAGPAGLVCGAELARRGVDVRVIDKRAQPTEQSRAIAIHPRSLDMFERMGIVDELIATGVKATAMQLHAAQRMAFRVPLDSVESEFPFTLVTAQTETERVLAEHLRSLGVTVDRGVELVDLAQDSQGACLSLRHADGTTEQVSTCWVVGADGAHSAVRRLVNTKLEGCFDGVRFFLGDVTAQHQLDLDSMHTFFGPDGPVVVLPMRDNRIRVLAEVRSTPGEPINLHPDQHELQTILNRRVGNIELLRSHWLTSFEVRRARVPSYRFGRVFLAGDAAHIHSPAGGQGMNTGMQDAFNLAWKLAMAIRDEAGETLLDSYEFERAAVADKVLAFSDRLTRVGTWTGLPGRIRDVMLRAVSHLPAARRLVADTAAQVNVAYRNSPICPGRRLSHAKIVAGEYFPCVNNPRVQKQLSALQHMDHAIVTIASGHIPPVTAARGIPQVLVTTDDRQVAGYAAVISDPDGATARRFGFKNGGRVVVRPDGYLGTVAALNDSTGIASYFAKLSS